MVSMQIIERIEYAIGPDWHDQITSLRNACFPDCVQDRSYFKQLPHFRLLAFEGEQLVGHLGIDHRMMTWGGVPSPVFGVIDLCVHSEARGQGIATRLLQRAEEIAQKAEIEFMVLISQAHRLYQRNGYVAVSATCSWLRIDEHTNYGVAVERFEEELMIKGLQGKSIPDGPVDFLGYMF